MDKNYIIFSGSGNPDLAVEIAKETGGRLGQALVSSFADGETRVELKENVRGRDVYIVQPTSAPANHLIMEALIMVDACSRASASSITLVMPYFGYSRQERKNAPRTPITAKLVADLYEAAGVSRVLALELHTSAIQGFFSVPVDHLFANSVFFDWLEKCREQKDWMVVSPDAGGVERARAMAKRLNCGLGIIDKRRDKPNESMVMHIIGDVKGKDCLIVDDIVDTAGSLVRGAQALHSAGAKSVQAAVAHAVLSGDAVAKIIDSPIQKLVVTNSIPLSAAAQVCEKIEQVSVGELLGQAVIRLQKHESISALFHEK
ncbi:MAG: ribose-phosphate diphosphokinase [Oligoflexales bacterium]